MENEVALPLILALTLTSYVTAMWVTKVTNERGDYILYGLVNGAKASRRDRWIMLVTMWFPYAMFLIAFLIIMALGNLEVARNAHDPRVETFGYMCAVFLGTGAVFWFVLGMLFVLRHLVTAIRNSDAEENP